MSGVKNESCNILQRDARLVTTVRIVASLLFQFVILLQLQPSITQSFSKVIIDWKLTNQKH